MENLEIYAVHVFLRPVKKSRLSIFVFELIWEIKEPKVRKKRQKLASISTALRSHTTTEGVLVNCSNVVKIPRSLVDLRRINTPLLVL